MTPRRVVVTGIGPVTPVGIGRKAFWSSLAGGRSGIGPITSFDITDFPVRIAGEVTDFELTDFLDRKKARKVERFTHLAHAAAGLAIADAELDLTATDRARVGVVIGTAYAGMARLEVEHGVLMERGPKAVPPEISMSMTPNAAASFVAIEHGLLGPVECTSAACAASAHALSRAVDLIRYGRADVVLAGGTDAAITPLAMAAFATARALSTRNDDPTRACRPFDLDRDGFVFSEGSCVLVLESAEHAAARGRQPLAEMLGYGHTSDAYNLATPRPDGEGAVAAMREAMADGGVDPASIGYVNAHAASTPAGDLAEVVALRKTFGDAVPATSSTKSMTGHLLGGAGATEAAATILALHEQVLPPTINLDTPDPACDIDLVANVARPADVTHALSNSFGLGGVNCSLLFARTS